MTVVCFFNFTPYPGPTVRGRLEVYPTAEIGGCVEPVPRTEERRRFRGQNPLAMSSW